MEAQIQIITSKNELNDAFTIRETVFIIEQSVPREIELDEYDQTATHFIAYDQGKPIATARIRPYKENTAKVERVAVLKELRGTGIGKQLMVFIEQESAKMGFSTLRLNSQKHAEEFYSKLGYITISEPFYEADIEHVTMEKKVGDIDIAYKIQTARN